jgi:hypothetical protein
MSTIRRELGFNAAGEAPVRLVGLTRMRPALAEDENDQEKENEQEIDTVG